MQTTAASSASRVFTAADVLLRALQSPEGLESTVPVFVGPADQRLRRARKAFTLEEFVEAMTLLMRLGLVDRPAHAQSAAHVVS